MGSRRVPKPTFPGKVVDVNEEDEVEVEVMHSVGINRYTWPSKPDRVWYMRKQFIGLISEPIKVTRHLKLTDEDWAKVESY